MLQPTLVYGTLVKFYSQQNDFEPQVLLQDGSSEEEKTRSGLDFFKNSGLSKSFYKMCRDTKAVANILDNHKRPPSAAKHNLYDQCQLCFQSPANHILSAVHVLRKTDKQLGHGLFVINTIHCHANAT